MPGIRRPTEAPVRIWTGEQVFFFGNFLAGVDLAEFRDQIDRPPDPDTTPTAQAARAADNELNALIVANVHISNGPFYLDGAGRLCGVQRVTVTRVSAILSAVNVATRADQADEAVNPKTPATMRAVYDHAATDPRPSIVMDGNRVVVRAPSSRRDFDERDDSEFTRAGGTVSFADDISTMSFGRSHSEREALTLPVHPGQYRPNAIAFVREHFGLAEEFDPVADADRFFSTPAHRR